MEDKNRYRSHLTATSYGRATEPTFAEALHFFTSIHRRDATVKKEIQGDKLRSFVMWRATQLRRDRANSLARGNTGGLRDHIKIVHGWQDDRKDNNRKRKHGTPASSTDIGSRVDKQLEHLFSGGQVADMHLYTRWVITYLAHRQWLPLECQLRLWPRDNQSFHTAVDMIAFDLTRQCFILIELKTGYAHNYNVVVRKATATEVFGKTDRNLCHLQAGWMFFEMVRSGCPQPLEAYVLRVNNIDGVRKPEPVDRRVIEYYNSDKEMGVILPLPAPSSNDDDDDDSASSDPVEEIDAPYVGPTYDEDGDSK